MNSQAWGFLFALGAAYFFLAAMCRAAAEPTPKPERPTLAYRILMDGQGIPQTVSVEFSPEAEKLLAAHEWVNL